jgi:hypothetical protein
MVFCRQCQKQVEDCQHFVLPLKVKRIPVFDPKVKTLAYDEPRRVLEISFKNGQTWQLRPVTKETYDELLHQTLSSFLKFIAHRYQVNPVRDGTPKPIVPQSKDCPACHEPMTVLHQMLSQNPVRILWHCDPCNQSLWHTYSTTSVRERKNKWH